MKVILDIEIYRIAFNNPTFYKYIKDISGSHNVISSKIIFDDINEFLIKSNNRREVNLYITTIYENIDFINAKGNISGNCGYMDNYTATLAKETNSDYIIYFKNRCFERMEKEEIIPKTIHIYDFVRKYIQI